MKSTAFMRYKALHSTALAQRVCMPTFGLERRWQNAVFALCTAVVKHIYYRRSQSLNVTACFLLLLSPRSLDRSLNVTACFLLLLAPRSLNLKAG